MTGPHKRSILDVSDPSLHTKASLEGKRPLLGEIEVTLTENCNIACDFCFHDKASKVGLTRQSIMSKLELVEEFFTIRKGSVSMMQLNMVGGELFQDGLLDEFLPYYFDFSLAVKALAEESGYSLRIVWVSNFLFKRTEVIADFMRSLKDSGLDSHLICSYDVTGRPINKQYGKNVSALKEFIGTVNMVATVSTIAELLKGGDSYFDWLYSNFDVYLDDYIPDPGHDAQMPTDAQLLQFYLFLYQKYPNIITIREMSSDELQPMRCLSLNKLTIFPDNSTANCLWNRYSPSDFVSEFNRQDNAGKMQTHIETCDCHSCEYFQRCGMRCFVQSDWRNRVRDFDGCILQEFYFRTNEGLLEVDALALIESLEKRAKSFKRKIPLIPAVQVE